MTDPKELMPDDVIVSREVLQEELAEYEHVNQLLNRDNKSWRKDNKALREAIDDVWPILQGGMTLSGLPHTAVGKIMDRLDEVLNQPHTGGK